MKIKLLYGPSTKLPKTISNGNVYICIDNGATYVDLSGSRVKLGSNWDLVDTSDVIDDVNTNTYIKYVAQSLTADQKTQARTNIGALSTTDLDWVIL